MKKLPEEDHALIVDFYNTVKDVPPEKFITDFFYDDNDNCCIIGHYNKKKTGDAGFDNKTIPLWDLTRNIFIKLHGSTTLGAPNLADINNSPRFNGYKHESIKDRGICFLEDYLEAVGEITKEDRLVKEYFH